jgi:hypothetical protein
MEKTIRTDTIKIITVLLPIKEHKRVRYIMAYREPPNICPGLIFVRKDFLMGAYSMYRARGLIYFYCICKLCEV